MELIRISGEFERAARSKGETFRTREATLKTHALASGEAPVQTDLLKGYDVTATVYEEYSQAFHGGTEGFADLIKLGQTTRGMGDIGQKLDADLKRKCADLAVGRSQAKALGAVDAPPSDSRTATTDAAAITLLEAWLKAQNDGNFVAYQRFYAPEFAGVKRVGDSYRKEFDRSGWLNDRKGMFNEPMTVVANDRVIEEKDGALVVRFTQRWSAGTYTDEGTKELVLRRVGDAWLIVREELLNSKVISK